MTTPHQFRWDNADKSGGKVVITDGELAKWPRVTASRGERAGLRGERAGLRGERAGLRGERPDQAAGGPLEGRRGGRRGRRLRRTTWMDGSVRSSLAGA